MSGSALRYLLYSWMHYDSCARKSSCETSVAMALNATGVESIFALSKVFFVSILRDILMGYLFFMCTVHELVHFDIVVYFWVPESHVNTVRQQLFGIIPTSWSSMAVRILEYVANIVGCGPYTHQLSISIYTNINAIYSRNTHIWNWTMKLCLSHILQSPSIGKLKWPQNAEC